MVAVSTIAAICLLMPLLPKEDIKYLLIWTLMAAGS